MAKKMMQIRAERVNQVVDQKTEIVSLKKLKELQSEFIFVDLSL